MANIIQKIGRDFISSVKNAFGGSLPDINPSIYNRADYEWFFDMGSGGIRHSFTYSDYKSAKDAYENCPPFGTIIDRKAQAHINGKVYVMALSGKGKNQVANTKVADQIRAKLNRPNYLQNGKQFLAEQKILVETFGWSFLWAVTPVGYEKYGAIEADNLWNIAPSDVQWEQTNLLWKQQGMDATIKNIVVSYQGVQQIIPLNQLYVFRSFRPNLCNRLFPESRAKALRQPISNVIAAYESRGELISHAGALGIISPKFDPGGAILLTPEDKADMQAQSKQKYGVRRGQNRTMYAPKPMDYTGIGKPTKDLMLFEEITDDSREIANGYGYPANLLGIGSLTFNNQATAEKVLYQDAIIPEADLIYDTWDAVFKIGIYANPGDDASAKLDIQADFSEVPALQEDKKAYADARSVMGSAVINEFDNNVIKYNRMLELLGEDTVQWGDAYKWELQRDGLLPGVPQTQQNDTTRTTAEASAAQQDQTQQSGSGSNPQG